MVIFVLRSFKIFATGQAIVPDVYSRGRKVRTAQSNAPVNSRVADIYSQQTDSATENNLTPNPSPHAERGKGK